MKWSTLKHNGVAFPPPHQPRGLSLIIRGERLALTPEQEEMAYAWGRKKDTPYVYDPVFAANFLSDFKQLLPAKYADISIKEIDFSEIHRYIEEEKARNSQPDIKKRLAAERKAQRALLKERFGYAELDGERVEVANWMVEPPGLFMGRGNHPLRGRWKPRVYPQDVTLNLSEDAPIPPGSWGKIVHDHDSMWLASWVDRLTDKEKYVWLADTAAIRQSRDRAKYDTALKLESHIRKVRAHILRGMRSRDERERKIATVCYLIDKLAMRVGDEKDPDEADTVGASTLRVEHVMLTPNSIDFDFLGKDSVRWVRSIPVNEADAVVIRNLREFLHGKQEGDPLFDGINSESVNRFLGQAMPRLTAKVFRTFHATNVVRDYLANHDDFDGGAPEHVKLYYAKLANLEAAMDCNHKRTPPKNFDVSLAKKEEKLQQAMVQTPRTARAKARLEERIAKLRLQVELAKRTREYNLNTSLRNYIDPRVYKAWSNHVGLEWQLIYPKTLQRKFAWANRARVGWKNLST